MEVINTGKKSKKSKDQEMDILDIVSPIEQCAGEEDMEPWTGTLRECLPLVQDDPSLADAAHTRPTTPRPAMLCARCVDVCPEYCLAIVPFEDLDLEADERAALAAHAGGNGLPLAAMIKDDDRCIRCGLCAIRCPTDAMTMERFQITERYRETP